MSIDDQKTSTSEAMNPVQRYDWAWRAIPGKSMMALHCLRNSYVHSMYVPLIYNQDTLDLVISSLKSTPFWREGDIIEPLTATIHSLLATIDYKIHKGRLINKDGVAVTDILEILNVISIITNKTSMNPNMWNESGFFKSVKDLLVAIGNELDDSLWNLRKNRNAFTVVYRQPVFI